jgi:hypothetical protein
MQTVCKADIRDPLGIRTRSSWLQARTMSRAAANAKKAAWAVEEMVWLLASGLAAVRAIFKRPCSDCGCSQVSASCSSAAAHPGGTRASSGSLLRMQRHRDFANFYHGFRVWGEPSTLTLKLLRCHSCHGAHHHINLFSGRPCCANKSAYHVIFCSTHRSSGALNIQRNTTNACPGVRTHACTVHTKQLAQDTVMSWVVSAGTSSQVLGMKSTKALGCIYLKALS